EQIVLNLVMNSIHAIRKAIQDGRTNGHYMIFSATVRKSKIAIDITDSGCGIASENMKKLFSPFFTTKQVGEGTGLGLAIVAQLVREIGGEISVQSTPGEGTTFTLLLNAVHDETLSSN
ncbi:two-component sensor histidine kinase, partial [bacterium]|nr:two-component sensor histidine kinase [bacterium]